MSKSFDGMSGEEKGWAVFVACAAVVLVFAISGVSVCHCMALVYPPPPKTVTGDAK